jgi:putative membrane protein
MKDKSVFKIILALSLFVFGVVVILYSLPKQNFIPEWAKQLPLLNATINGACSLLLVISLWCIKNKKIQWHKRLNLATFMLSSLFLVSYIIFHAFGVETKFPADNPMRPFYLVILLTHILLAAIVLPLVLVSFYFGLTGKIEKHRKVSKFTFPIWLYVTVTGVVVYLMISPYYQF